MTTMPQRESTIAVPDDRREQLGAFLRARRESLDPQRLGLPRVGRRRTPGLRREEVAMLADVGVTLVHLAGAGAGGESVGGGAGGGGECPAVQSAGDPASVRARRADPAGSHPGDGVRRHQPRDPPDAGQPDAAAGQHSETEL